MKIRVIAAFARLTAYAAGMRARVPCRFIAYYPNAELLSVPPD